jgi:thiamine transport system ATP-binding protein
MLGLDQVSVAYAGRDVLHAVDLAVPAGQLLCVLGPSGGGKTTLLRAVAGLETLRAGRITLDGRDLAGVPAHERGVGLMFQDYALFPHRDVADNVAFGLRMRGVSAGATRGRVRELLALVGLPGTERRSVAQLSGGEQQRVALARALAPGPRLLMLDEPMGSLDRALREQLPEELRAIFGELGLTVLYVTHDQDEALSVADRVVLLDAGRIVADATPEALWRRPPSAWVARFLGFRNVAEATLREGVASTPWGDIRLPGVADGLVTIVLRPEALSLRDGLGPAGRVRARRFGGDHVRVVVDTDAGASLELEVRDGRPPEAGQRVSVAVDPSRVNVLRAISASPGPAPRT